MCGRLQHVHRSQLKYQNRQYICTGVDVEYTLKENALKDCETNMIPLVHFEPADSVFSNV